MQRYCLSHLSLFPLSLWLTDSVSRYICGSTSWSVSTSAQTFIAKPNMVRNRALTSYSRAPSLINSQCLLGRHTEVSRQPRGTPTFHIRQPGRLQNIVACQECQRPAAGQAVDTGTFQDHTLLLYDFALAMAPLDTWLMSARQQPRLMGKYCHLTLANNRKHTSK